MAGIGEPSAGDDDDRDADGEEDRGITKKVIAMRIVGAVRARRCVGVRLRAGAS